MDGYPKQSSVQHSAPSDADPAETREWLESLSAVIQDSGPERGVFLVQQLEGALREIGAADASKQFSAYRNSIPLERQDVRLAEDADNFFPQVVVFGDLPFVHRRRMICYDARYRTPLQSHAAQG